MHPSAYEHGRLFFQLYWRPEFTEVVELGSQNVNGSLRDHCPAGARYVGMDMAPREWHRPRCHAGGAIPDRR